MLQISSKNTGIIRTNLLYKMIIELYYDIININFLLFATCKRLNDNWSCHSLLLGLSVHLFVCLSVCLFVCLSVCLFMCLSTPSYLMRSCLSWSGFKINNILFLNLYAVYKLHSKIHSRAKLNSYIFYHTTYIVDFKIKLRL